MISALAIKNLCGSMVVGNIHVIPCKCMSMDGDLDEQIMHFMLALD
jgi:hypothetical protein